MDDEAPTPKRNDHGFDFGALNVEATCSDARRGWVVVTLKTPKHSVEVYVTKTGKMRINGFGVIAPATSGGTT